MFQSSIVLIDNDRAAAGWRRGERVCGSELRLNIIFIFILIYTRNQKLKSDNEPKANVLILSLRASVVPSSDTLSSEYDT